MLPVNRALILGAVIAAGSLAALPGWTVGNKARSYAPTDIYVEQLDGAIDLTMAEVRTEVEVGSLIETPSRIVTGDDGTIGIRQGGTGVSVAPDSDVEIFEAARDGQLIAHMFQHRGSVFYDVETRPVEKLRIETPHLVAVVKGTQFTVTVANGTTTISLFEGILEIRSPDDSQVVELDAGEIAIRSLIEDIITVLPMNADLLDETADLNPRETLEPAAAGRAGAKIEDEPVDGVVRTGLLSVDGGLADGAIRQPATIRIDPVRIDTGADLVVTEDLVGSTVDIKLDPSLDVDTGLETGLDPGLNAGRDIDLVVDPDVTAKDDGSVLTGVLN